MPNVPALGVYALTAVFVCLHMVVIDSYSGAARGRSKTTPNKEDKRGNVEVVAEDPDAVARVNRAHRNLFVNGVPFLVLGLVMVLLGASKATAIAYFATWIVARIGHSVAYLAGKQPYRSIAFGIGQLALLGIIYQVVRGALALL